MSDTILVKAARATKCPIEGKPRAYITDDKAVEVPATQYYLRLIQDGSLVREEAVTKGK